MAKSTKSVVKTASANIDKALTNINMLPQAEQMKSKVLKGPDIKADDSELKAAVAPKKAQSFGEAFRAARADKGAGKTFTWGGKSYSTNTAGEGIKRPQPARSGTSSSAPARPSAPAASRPAAPAANRTPPAQTQSRANAFAAPTAGKDTLKANIERRNKLVAPKKEPGYFERMTTNIATRNKDAMARMEDARKTKAIADRAAKAKEDAAAKKRAEDFRKANAGWEFGMKAPGKAKGGKIDGCAIRGKTRAPLKKGK